MKSSAPITSPLGQPHAKGAFTLVELLSVLAIAAILSVLVVQSIGALQDTGNITSAAYNLSGILENARAYAMANNTYTWVGFYEEAPNGATVSSTVIANPPPYTQANSNVGQVLVGVAASLDGTRSFTSGNLVAVQKLTVIRNLHITSLVPLANNLTGNLATRTTADSYLDCENTTLNSTSALGFPVISNFTFYKTICFSPRGEAELDTVNSSSTITSTMQHLVEIGLVPTHGGIVNKSATNLVALQISGLGGVVKIYRP
jgi:prepilin-type N-terminal cleavage/methylation domain-containing protein